MKTTIDIADDLIRRAKIIQARDDVTLRALVEDGLREIIAQRGEPRKHRFVPVVAGPAKIDYSFTPEKVNRLIDASRERSWLAREFSKAAEKVKSRGKSSPAGAKRKRSA